MQDKFNNVSELEVLLEKTDKAEIQPVVRQSTNRSIQ